MPLKLMYITNNTKVAQIAEKAGVDRIFIDMEYIGKEKRQGGMDTVQSHHTFEDIQNMKKNLTNAELLVRCNPIHDATKAYCSSKEEIDKIIEYGADIVMLPYFKTVKEVNTFLNLVNKRAKTMLLFETKEAVTAIDDILDSDGIDETYIGLNDLSLSYKKKFMFELLADGTVEKICHKFQKKNYTYGFGGIASIGKGQLPAEKIIIEHYRLGSSCAILSRSFCDTNKISAEADIKATFNHGIKAIRELERECYEHFSFFNNNKLDIFRAINQITGGNDLK